MGLRVIGLRVRKEVYKSHYKTVKFETRVLEVLCEKCGGVPESDKNGGGEAAVECESEGY